MKVTLYMAVCKPNGKLYFGVTDRTLRRRVSDHFSSACKSPYRFHRSIRKYGREAFEWVELAHVERRDAACLLERALIRTFNTTNAAFGYNSTEGGEGVRGPRIYRNSMKGRKLSEEHREKLREAWKRRPPVTQETKDKLRAAHQGRSMKFSPEALQKISSANKGRHRSEETKAKMRGRIVTEETRHKLRAAKQRKGVARADLHI